MDEAKEGQAAEGGLEALARQVQGLDLARLSSRLAALDQEQSDDSDLGGAMPGASAARAALERLREMAAGQPVIAEREAVLAALVGEVEARLREPDRPQDLAQGLRRLGQAAYEERDFGPPPDPATEEVREALADFERAFRQAQTQGRAALEAALGLEMMPDQTALPLDPARHNVVASVAGDDPSRDNTVARQDAPGWLLRGQVLVRADVERYSAAEAGLPVDEIDEAALGKRVT